MLSVGEVWKELVYSYFSLGNVIFGLSFLLWYWVIEFGDLYVSEGWMGRVGMFRGK